MLTLEQGKKLIKIARDAIIASFSRKDVKISQALQKEFSMKQGCFVTLNKDGQLRGCIGFVDPVYELWDSIAKAAKSAAFNDPRFPPLDNDEFPNVTIEVSVLTPPRLIEVRNPEELPNKIDIGKDGLMIVETFKSGLLLPQVAVEHDWDAITFLRQTCVKAGMPADSWMDFDACRVYKFQGIVFSEKTPNGEVVQGL